MTIHTAIIRLVNVDAVGNIVYKKNATIDKVLVNAGTEARIFEESSGSAPNAASDGDVTAPTLHEYLTAEDLDGYTLIHLDQYYIITKS